MIQIYYDIDTMRRVNADGAPITLLPAFFYNTAPVVQFQFQNNGTPIDLSGIAAWRAAIDTDFNSTSDPAVRVTSDGIDASQSASGILSVTFDCRSAGFLTKLNNSRTVTGWLDIYGVDGSGISIFIAQMQVLLFSVVDPEQGTPPVIPDLYPSSAAVQAMINAAVEEFDTELEGKENTGVAQGLVSAHNASATAHEALFGAKADKAELDLLLPAGTVIAYAGSVAPEGFIACNGAAVSRETYANLFAAIGTLYGSGDGSTTFNLPDLTDRVVQGSATAGTALAAGLPDITGVICYGISMPNGEAANSGAFYTNPAMVPPFEAVNTGTVAWSSGKWGRVQIQYEASRSNSIYGNSTTVQPPALTMIYCIKY